MLILLLYLLLGYTYAHYNYIAIELTVIALKQEEEGIEDVPDSVLIAIVSGVVIVFWLPLFIEELINNK